MSIELTSVKIQSKLMEGLWVKYPKSSLNEIMTEISSNENRMSRKIYRDEDVLYAVEQLKVYRKDNPKLSVEEIFKMIKEYRLNEKKNSSTC